MYDRMGRDGRDPSRRAWPAWTIAAIAIATLSAVVVAHWLGTATPTATRALATAPGGDDDAEVSDASPLIEDGLHHLPKIWSFALDRHALGILDVDPGGGLPAALLAAQAEVVVNAGFFGPNGEPVGLVVTNGKTRQPSTPVSLAACSPRMAHAHGCSRQRASSSPAERPSPSSAALGWSSMASPT